MSVVEALETDFDLDVRLALPDEASAPSARLQGEQANAGARWTSYTCGTCLSCSLCSQGCR